MVDVMDIVLLALVALAAVHGLRLGALVQVLTFGGFVAGILLGTVLVSSVASPMHAGTARILVTLLLFLGPAVVLGSLGHLLGAWGYAVVRRVHLGPVDGVLGVVVAVLSVLLAAWLVAGVLAQSADTWLTSQLRQSAVLRAMDRVMPPVPGVFHRVEALLASSDFPSVFAGDYPTLAPPVPLPSTVAAQADAAVATHSMVKVIGQACGYLQEGSGFVVAPGLVVTNAHVVAGEPSVQVQVYGIPYPATPVLFDPRFDLAVLRTGAPLGPPLTLDPRLVGRGTRGAILGFPDNGPLVARRAGVAASMTAQGWDIYGRGSVVRSVYQVDADVEPGNSGGPMVAADGQVIGVVFSRSTGTADVGYALASPGVLTRVQEAEGRTATVGTGACTQG